MYLRPSSSFGNIHDAAISLGDFGLVAEKQILWLEEQYPYLEMHNFVIMPNQVHLLFSIDRIKVKNEEMKIKTVSSLMGTFKTTTSKQIRLLGNADFEWQRSFHDHIVRSKDGYDKIYSYISNNPENWEKDKFKNEE